MEKLSTIQIDLDAYKIILKFHGDHEPLVIHFDTPSRRFYFSVIALIIIEMKKHGKPGFIHIHKYKKELKLLDESLSGKHASKHIEGLLGKIRVAWRHRLPDLETATLFKVIDRDLISPYERGGKYRYKCSDVECDTWANLFGYDDNNKWRFKFAIDSVSISLNDISLTLGKLRDDSAWNEYIKCLSVEPKPETHDKRVASKLWTKLAYALIAILIVCGASVAVWKIYLKPTTPGMVFELPEIPSIAVLPFVNISEDLKQEYFSDGLTDEIITALSSVPKLFVIARNSTFTYKGKSVKVQKISEELGVRYVLEGSVKWSGDQIRISAQLIDALSGHHLWAKQYDRNLEDIFAVQDEITQKIITSLQVKLTEGEHVRIFAKGTNNLQAYLKCLQANEHLNRLNVESNELGKRFAEEAIALDPEYASPYYCLAGGHIMDVWLGVSKDPKKSITQAMTLLQKAIALEGTYAEAHGLLGFLYSMTRQHERALFQAEKAIALNPNSAENHYRLGKVMTFAGRWEESIPNYERAIRLNPIPPNKYIFSLGLAYGWVGRYDEAITWCQKAIRQEPNSLLAHLFMTSVYRFAGKDQDARTEAAEVIRIQPDFSIEKFSKKLTYKNKEDAERVVGAWRKAGLK